MNVPATLEAIKFLTEKWNELAFNDVARPILIRAVIYLEDGLHAYLTKGVGED